MRGPGWDNDVWSKIKDYELFWTPFAAQFRFRPGMNADTWPAIAEPAGSVDFDLAPVFAREAGFPAGEDALNLQVLKAMTAVFAKAITLVALDWQHPSYWFGLTVRHRSLNIGASRRFLRGLLHLPDAGSDAETFGHSWESPSAFSATTSSTNLRHSFPNGYR